MIGRGAIEKDAGDELVGNIDKAEIPKLSEHAAPLLDEVFLESLRRQMLQFAKLNIADAQLAEDAVQEALAGALKNMASFTGRAALKSWVFAILKNKIADILRHRQRMIAESNLISAHDEPDSSSTLFDLRGAWQTAERPARWADPESTINSKDFWKMFQACLDHLPSLQARVFMMREFIELDTPEICRELSLSISNVNVMMHRARLRLRKCVENNWFLAGEKEC